ncbi:MAG: hypothetical protein ABFS18_11505 [Thermodesulfobacteriota bacterium]
MKFWLYSNGGLLEGAREEVALQAIIKISKLSEAEARRVFLSGKKRKIKSAADCKSLEKFAEFLRRAGVDVVVIPETEGRAEPKGAGKQSVDNVVAQESSGPIGVDQKSSNSKPKSSPRRGRLIAISVVVLTVLIGIAAYGWYRLNLSGPVQLTEWLDMSEPEQLATAENALADGSMVAIGYLDMAKTVALYEHFFDNADPEALPVPDSHKDVLKQLFTGKAQFRKNLKLATFSINAKDKAVAVSAGVNSLLAGNFNAEHILSALMSSYEIIALDQGRWKLVKIKQAEGQGGSEQTVVCKDPDLQTGSAGNRAQSVSYLYIDPQWLLIGDQEIMADSIWQRLHDGAEAAQGLTTWHAYRSGKLTALMVFSPDQAAKSIKGIPGMMATGAAQKAPDVKGVAVGATVGLDAKLKVNGSLFSENGAWNNETAAKGQKAIDELVAADTSSSTPTLAKLSSRLQLASNKTRISADIDLDKEMLTEMDNVGEEALAAVFTPQISMDDSKIEEEQIAQNPMDYDLYKGISRMPDYRPKENDSAPIFMEGPYGVALKSFSPMGNGLVSLALEGMIALPKGRPFSAPDTEKISFYIDDVLDYENRSLLRDESCVSRMEVHGERNYEPVTYFSSFDERASLTKRVRLVKGTVLKDIARIKGRLSFSVPTKVGRFKLPAETGASIEHNGVRVYLNGIKGSNVSYQVSGEQGRLLEVRGLNNSGQVLQGSWSSGIGGRMTRGYKGEVKGVELFIADTVLSDEKEFELSDILVSATPADKKDKPVNPYEFAPESMDIALWGKYEKLDLSDLQPSDNNRWSGISGNSIYEGIVWPGVKMWLYHDPDNWSPQPKAKVYLPVLPELQGVLSVLSSRVEIPSAEEDQPVYQRIQYPHYIKSGKLSIDREYQGLKIFGQTIALNAETKQGRKLDRLKGELIVRLPLKISKTKIPLNDLWKGVEVDGIKVAITEVSWSVFTGYRLKIDGAIERLVNLHGIMKNGTRIIADSVNFQSGGYWTVTLPMGHGIEEVELVRAEKQKIIKLPFDVKPEY